MIAFDEIKLHKNNNA